MTEERCYPCALAMLKSWVVWRLEARDGKQTKIPYRPDGRGRASSTNPATWAKFGSALAALEREPGRYSGLGFVFSEGSGLVFIDLDHCLDPVTGELNGLATEVLGRFGNTYQELSQSRSGYHVICWGHVPKSFKVSSLGLEVYDRGRYCAMTGLSNGLDVTQQQEALDWLIENYAPPDKPPVSPTRAAQPGGPGRARRPSGEGSDSWVISMIEKRDRRGARLWAGDVAGAGYGSHSEADAALCTVLAFWTDGDPAAIDRLFRASGLCRAKWLNRPDYRERTISAALATCGETFSGWKQRRRREEVGRIGQVLSSAW